MSDNRETQPGGSPVEESEPTQTEVIAAVKRATGEEEPAGDAAADDAADAQPAEHSDSDEPEDDAAEDERNPFAKAEAARRRRAAERADEAELEATQAYEPIDAEPYAEDADAASRRARRAPVTLDELPSAVDDEAKPGDDAQPAETAERRDGEIRISADHPMAALYMQTPMPPELKGNRVAGVLISLLAAVAFAVVYAGVIAARLAPSLPPSQFVDGMLPFVTSWGFIAATAACFIGMTILVLIVGRAGWWAYVLGGFPVGVLVWAAAIAGYALDPSMIDATISTHWDVRELLHAFGLLTPTLGAAIVAREVTVWFGAWIGARGRKMKAKNAQLLAEYDEAMAEVRAKK